MAMQTRANPDNSCRKRQRFENEVEEPMDMMHGQEGLAFWSHWEHQCSMYTLGVRLLATRPGGRVERYLYSKLAWHGNKNCKSREDLAKYIAGTDKKAVQWRMTHEGLRYVLKQQCTKEFHHGACYCPVCFGLLYVKGHPTMVIVRIKSIIYELRQFSENARLCLFEMLMQSDIKMWGFQYKCLDRPCDVGTEPYILSLRDAKRKFEKYHYSQAVVTSMVLARDD